MFYYELYALEDKDDGFSIFFESEVLLKTKDERINYCIEHGLLSKSYGYYRSEVKYARLISKEKYDKNK